MTRTVHPFSTDSRPERAASFYLGPVDRAALVCVHRAQEPASGLGVVLVPPFGLEDAFSYRSRRAWAQRIAADGHVALRLDLPGSADSAGGPRDSDRLGAWMAAVTDAVAHLRTAQGCTRVAVIGIGLGGFVAGRAVAEGLQVDGLVLWAVPARGRAYVRELRAFARLEGSYVLDEPQPEADDAALAVGGYVLSEQTVAELEAAAIADLPREPVQDLPVLLLGRDTISVDGRLKDAFHDAGAQVEAEPGPGYSTMMAEPHLAQPPIGVFSRVGDWLDRLPGRPVAAAAAATLAPVPASPTLTLPVEGGTITERPLEVAQPFGALAGVLTEPAGPPAATAVLLNVGAQRRIGPNRMWVECARRWAARGVATLRLDIAGVGDADNDGAEWVDIQDFDVHVPEFVEQVQAALDALQERGLPARFIIGGVCSGAYWAFQESLRDDRVAALLLINPSALVRTPWLEASRQARRARKVRQARIRQRIVRRQIPLRELMRVARAVVSYPLIKAARQVGHDPNDRALDGLRQSGTDVLLLFTPDEPVYGELRRDGQLERLDRWPNVTIRELPGRGWAHTLQPITLQRHVNRALDAAVAAQAAGPDAPAPHPDHAAA